MNNDFRNMSPSEKARTIKRRVKPFLVIGSLVFVLWFLIAVFKEKQGGATSDDLVANSETSMRLRSEVRNWFRKTFPESAARADQKFGFFEMERDGLPISQSSWVVLVHGLDEPGDLWADLGPSLAEKGFNVLEFRYPNDQPVHESSVFFDEQLAGLIDSEPLIDGLHLIGHSMGGLVLRNFITHPDLLPQAAWKEKAPVKTLIQLGTPNHGSWLATYRLPVELRDHLYKDYGMDAMLGMIWDGAGEAQLDLQPESIFLKQLNERPFPENIYWVGVAGTGSPVGLPKVQGWVDSLKIPLNESIEKIQATFPELFNGSGDGVVSIDSLRCDGMNEVFYVDAHHRNMVRNPNIDEPPALPIVLAVLQRDSNPALKQP